MTTTHTHKVVTWTTPSGQRLDVCTACEDRLRAAREWPRNDRGEEYCQATFGRHEGLCHLGPTYAEGQ
jgi:hypothetical protein